MNRVNSSSHSGGVVAFHRVTGLDEQLDELTIRLETKIEWAEGKVVRVN